jgi:hypothetical protein
MIELSLWSKKNDVSLSKAMALLHFEVCVMTRQWIYVDGEVVVNFCVRTVAVLLDCFRNRKIPVTRVW